MAVCCNKAVKAFNVIRLVRICIEVDDHFSLNDSLIELELNHWVIRTRWMETGFHLPL